MVGQAPESPYSQAEQGRPGNWQNKGLSRGEAPSQVLRVL